jgi:hypothetical protein
MAQLLILKFVCDLIDPACAAPSLINKGSNWQALAHVDANLRIIIAVWDMGARINPGRNDLPCTASLNAPHVNRFPNMDDST